MWQNHLDRFDRHRVIQNPFGIGCYTVIIYVWSDHNNSFLYFQWKLSKILHDNKCQNFSVFRKPWFAFQSSLYKFLSTYKYISLNIIRSFFYSRQSTGCSLNIVFFLNSASSAAALVFYLPGVCTHTDIERKQSPENILKSSKKHNI